MIFRYPGGKTKIANLITEFIYPKFISSGSNSFYEPFIGGGSVSCKIAKDFPNCMFFVNDKNEYLYSFWKLFEENNEDKFKKLYELLEVIPTTELFQKLRNTLPQTDVEKAYYSIFFNRTTFSGIYSAGPIGGVEQKSKWTVDCRYNFKSMFSKIEQMRELFKNRLFVSNLDVKEFLQAVNPNAIMYLDPPYYVKGKMLYENYMLEKEHIAMAEELKKRTNWVLSYDICKEIDLLYEFAKKTPLNMRYSINGKKENWIKKDEYMIESKL